MSVERGSGFGDPTLMLGLVSPVVKIAPPNAKSGPNAERSERVTSALQGHGFASLPMSKRPYMLRRHTTDRPKAATSSNGEQSAYSTSEHRERCGGRKSGAETAFMGRRT